MSKQRALHEDAVYWAMRRQSHTMEPSEQAEFQKWLSEPANAELLSEIENAAAAFDNDKVDILASEFERELNALAAKKQKRLAPVAAIAASITGVTLAVGLSVSSLTSPLEEGRYETAIGEIADYRLGDGSTLVLNTTSAVSVRFTKSKRHVSLNHGEVLFDVAHDPGKPFLIDTPHGDILVTGTSFNVESYALRTDVSVVSGAVSVTPDKGPQITLIAGQQLSIDVDGRANNIEAFDPNTTLAWRNGKARYNSTPLNQVILDLNRYFRRPIVLNDPSLATLPVTGEFSVNDQQTTINALVVAFGLQQTPEPGRIILSRKDSR